MDQALSNLLATGIGALAGLSGALLTVLLQQTAEHKKWFREQAELAYSSALKSLAKATIIPIGIDLCEIKKWFDCLSEVRESLIVLQVYCSEGRERLADQIQKLFRVIDENSYVLVATTATTFKGKGDEDDISGFVLLEVGKIRSEIPLQGIENLKNIHSVILNGEILDREKLLAEPH
ncbi:MAG: hypothetical protein QOF89_2660 [Acidobacteriota bacterium]|jgi:hypothetical protein|nr:hypothetical protein [Acidobacteriota bacterium]